MGPNTTYWDDLSQLNSPLAFIGVCQFDLGSWHDCSRRVLDHTRQSATVNLRPDRGGSQSDQQEQRMQTYLGMVRWHFQSPLFESVTCRSCAGVRDVSFG